MYLKQSTYLNSVTSAITGSLDQSDALIMSVFFLFSFILLINLLLAGIILGLSIIG